MIDESTVETAAGAAPAKARKAAAKKAPAKKVAKKIAAPEAKAKPEAVSNGIEKPKPARKTAAAKKAAAILAQMQQAEESMGERSLAPVAAEAVPVVGKVVKTTPLPEERGQPIVATPPTAPAVEIIPAPPIETVPAPAPAAESELAPAPVAAPMAPVSGAAHGGPASHEQAPQQERRKSKFERWKERRERFRQERMARQGKPPGQAPSDSHAATADDGDRGREPEKPLGPPEPADGVLEMTPKGYGFLRQRDRMYAQHPLDAFIAPEFIRQYGLREGMQVKGIQQKGSRGPQVTSVTEVNGRAPEAMRDLPLFEELKAINPNKRLQLETTKTRLTTRVIDMFTPVGRGQRGLIVAPPRAGKTTLLEHIAEAVVENHPGTHLMILLVDERPEEVTEFRRTLQKAEIYASSNDQDVKSHTRIAAFAIERAKRLVECGEHVFMLLDSITRMARAFNNAKQGGATMSGGMGVGAMEIPRRLFAAARNTRGAGSLTILATALVETGSRMDDLIFQEFKGTGNMELVLDRKIAEQFYYPAVNIFKSGTRREELLLQPFQLDKIHMLRRGLAGHKPIEAIQRVLSLLERYPNNAQMLVDLPSKS